MVEIQAGSGVIDVEVRHVASQSTACVHLLRRPSELPGAFGRYLPHIGRVVGQHAGRFDGPPYLLYLGTYDGKLDVELGMPLVAPIDDLPPVRTLSEGAVGMGELPAGRVAVCVYTGPYDGLGDAWADFNGKLAQEGFSAGNVSWESYIDNPDFVPAYELRTVLYQLLD